MTWDKSENIDRTERRHTIHFGEWGATVIVKIGVIPVYDKVFGYSTHVNGVRRSFEYAEHMGLERAKRAALKELNMRMLNEINVLLEAQKKVERVIAEMVDG